MTQTNPSCPYIITSDEGTSYCRLAEHSANSQPTPNPSQIRSSDITPPPELVQQWGHNANLSGVPHNDKHWAYEQHIATQAAQWGADQELEACLRLVEIDGGEDAYDFARYIRTARRPKPPSLKEQSLALIDLIQGNKKAWDINDLDVVRRALEALPND